MNKTELQAHQGVASECPGNTMSAFACAVQQGYDVIELDLGYTSDKQIVVLHDDSINRTARMPDGNSIDKEVLINTITYKEALEYDFGIAFSNKFSGEKIPLFSDVLHFASENKIRLKIDNKIQAFPKELLDIFFALIKPYSDFVSITSNNLEFIDRCIGEISHIHIDYDGAVSEEILCKLSEKIEKSRLTVWLPYECEATSWVKVVFADEKLSALVKKYAKLGIWLIKKEEYFYDASERLKADIIETDGVVKPIQNVGQRYDMHTHSESSHDSECPVCDMADAAYNSNLSGFAVTDHCDIEYCDSIDLFKLSENSTRDANSVRGRVTALKGTEIGEGFWNIDVAEKILNSYDFDVVIGSVHAVKFKGYDMPYSQINFDEMESETIKKYMDKYFDDMLEMIDRVDFDILAHMTCPLRYINGKYNCGIGIEDYSEKIKLILKMIIEKGIALEINTSCVFDESGYCELLPEQSIIKLYKELGGYLITTGSDAHIAENSANYFDELYVVLKEIGFENTYYYKNRVAIPCKIV